MAAINTNLPQSEPSSEKQKPNHASSPSVASKPEVNGLDAIDYQHFKDLQKSLRNAVKKLNATAKVDAIVAENPGKTLDDLVAEKKINVDQKAQALKKPSLQATVAQIEEQIAQFKDFAVYYEERLASQKADLEKAHKEELEALQEQATAAASNAGQQELRQKLLNLSKFLCAAATVRRSGDETSSESRAFEGVLYQVYGGTQDAVTSMLKIIDGVDDKVVGVDGTTLEVTYERVKQVSAELAPSSDDTTPEAAPVSDPSVANAAYTELQDTSYIADATVANESAPAAEPEPEQVTPPAQTLVGDGANAVAEASWDANASGVSSTNTEGWVEVPRDPAETETGLEATPAAVEAEATSAPAAGEQSAENVTVPKPQGPDGFEAVVHHQRQPSGRGRGRSGHGHGRGRGDGFRGRGRGEFRGHGRGRGRGGRGRGGANGNGNGNGNGTPSAAPAGTQ